MSRLFWIAAFGLGMTALGTGCSAPEDPSAPMVSNESAPSIMPSAPIVCADHGAGCPCDQPGEVVECGRVKRVVDNYVWCSTGMQTCGDDGTWGKCLGDQVAAPVAQ